VRQKKCLVKQEEGVKDITIGKSFVVEFNED
jgi:hypothetical protein